MIFFKVKLQHIWCFLCLAHFEKYLFPIKKWQPNIEQKSTQKPMPTERKWDSFLTLILSVKEKYFLKFSLKNEKYPWHLYFSSENRVERVNRTEKKSSLGKQLNPFTINIFIWKISGSSKLQKVFWIFKPIWLFSLVAFCFILSAFFFFLNLIFYSGRLWLETCIWPSTHTIYYISLTYVFLCPL